MPEGFSGKKEIMNSNYEMQLQQKAEIIYFLKPISLNASLPGAGNAMKIWIAENTQHQSSSLHSFQVQKCRKEKSAVTFHAVGKRNA